MPDRPATPDEIIDGYAKMFGVPADLARAVAQQESGGNINAPAGDSGKALGMFQLHEGAGIDTGVDRTNPGQNIAGGIKYLKQLSDRYKGDVTKTLMAYNGGMEAVDAGKPSEAAQAYASAIISKLTRGAATAPPGATEGAGTSAPLTDESKPVSAYTRHLERVASRPEPTTAADLVFGALHGAEERIKTISNPIRRVFGMTAAPPPPPETTTLGKIGKGAEQVGEFVLPAAGIAKGAEAVNLAGKLTAKGAPMLAAKLAAGTAEGIAQGAGAYGVSKLQGRPEGESRFNAALSTVAPVASKALEVAGPAIRQAAETKLARVFAKGVEGAGPEIQSALKTGDISPSVQDAVKIVRQAASDTIDLPIRASWGKWMTQAGKNVAETGQDLGTALQGPLGDQMLFKQPIIDALDDLLTKSATHLAEIQSGATTTKVYDPKLFDEVKKLKDFLNASGQDMTGYGPMISVRNLSDLKQVWDKAVYGLSTAGKVAVSPEVLTATAQKEAVKRGADAIRAVFDQKAPTIAMLNEAASHAYRLQDLVRKLHKVSPGLGPRASTLLHIGGAAAGAEAGSALGGHTLYGIMAGGALARTLQTAFESPAWQTLSPVVKGKLAMALANGSADTVRTILAPIIAGAPKGASSATPPVTKGTTPQASNHLDNVLQTLQRAERIGPDKLAEAINNPANWKHGELPSPDDVSKILTFLPKALPKLSQVANLVLKREGLLGFDTLAQARGAILQSPDWAERWNVAGETKGILDKWRAAHLLEHPPEKSVWQLFKDMVQEQTAKTKAESVQRARSSLAIVPKGAPPSP